MEIRELKTISITLLFPDDLDYGYISSKPFVEHLLQDFSFRNHAVDPNGVFFIQGVFSLKSVPIIIDELRFEPRRILCTMAADSETHLMFINQLIGLLEKTATGVKRGKRIQIIETFFETMCVVKLSKKFDDLIPNTGSFTPNVFDPLTKYALEGMSVAVTPISIKYQVEYQGESSKLKKSNVTMSNKLLEIEIRANTLIDDCVYYIKGPGRDTDLLAFASLLEGGSQ